MKMQTTITYRGPVEGKVKGYSAHVKQSLREVVKLWHSTMLPRHFDTIGALRSRYPQQQFKSRSRNYMIRKAKKVGHQRLLDFTGRTRLDVVRKITITGTSKGARGRMNGSNRALNFGGRADMPDLRAELTTVNQEESDLMAQVLGDKIAKFLNDRSETKVVKP